MAIRTITAPRTMSIAATRASLGEGSSRAVAAAVEDTDPDPAAIFSLTEAESLYQTANFLRPAADRSQLSVVRLHLRPNLLQIEPRPTAQPDGEVLIAARVRMLQLSGRLDPLKMFAVAAAVAAQNDHRAAVVLARTPQPVVVVLADGLGQTVARSIKIHCCGLTPAVAEDR